MEKEWLCSSQTSEKYGFKSFKTSIKRECEICGFSEVTRVHHVIPLSEGGDHIEENIVILCQNHHSMVHMTKYKDKIKLSKAGAKKKYTEEETKFNKEKIEAIDEAKSIIHSLMFELLNAEEVVPASKKLIFLFREYNFDYYDCLASWFGFSRDFLIKDYIINKQNLQSKLKTFKI